ncbi:hypothetical protein GCM10010387_62100 [Streptomyces inusitatus]|uniref:Uncharacterized protein n=1 Tax=Streptomyces inusitatus TaxID=68221 RepID=A0A918QML2_9ACTN|nr:hypothetical protein [Streptomyces inusitatus]GGZ59910.1 hypothetical protein GCM10010387_62100 [Streptomyces inusitatus]
MPTYEALHRFTAAHRRLSPEQRRISRWVVEAEEGRILASWAPSPFDDPVDDGDGESGDEWVTFTSIRPGTIGRYDWTVHRWVTMPC